MNFLWGGMILIGIIYGALNGTMQEVADAALTSSREAVTLCITMAGVTAFWTGLIKIAEESGMVAGLARAFAPFIRFLFPGIPQDHPAREQVSINIICNFLGAGWAATPAGIKAMESLAELEEERRTRGGNNAVPRGTASNEMCTFLILNISSLQLIPVNIIAYRAQYGSVNPTAIVGPGIAATAVSTLAAVVFCKAMEGLRPRGGSRNTGR